MKGLINKKIIYFLLILISFFWFFNQIFAATTTITYVWTSTDLWWWATWNSTNNAIWNTTSTSTVNNLSRKTNTNNLSLTNFDLSNAWLPEFATINWITVDIEWNGSHNWVRDRRVWLTKDWINPIWNNNWSNAWQTTKIFKTYWNSTDLWWTTWTTSELISSNFWIILNYRNRRNNNQSVNVYRTIVTIDYTLNPKPGWAWANLQIWLKADSWTSTTTNWNPLTTWNDQSWNWFNAWWWISPFFRNNNTDNLNYNPVVDFNWITQYLENLANWAHSQSYFAVIIPDQTVDWTLTWQVPFGFDCNSWILNTWTCWLTFAWLTLWAFTVAINDEVITHAIWSSTWWRSAQIWTASYQSTKPMLINMNENSSNNGTEISEKWLILDNYNANTYQTISTADYRIWMSPDWAYPFPYDWKIAEIINYNSRVSTFDKQKIESYLSIKYGITLVNWTLNYIASNWITNIWDTTTAWIYINDIFWIWRDDISGLSQIKSKSVNDDNVITIEAIWEWTNSTPTFIDINDNEFLSISNNDLWNTWTQIDSPLWYYNLSRKWRVQEVWELWTVNLDFEVWNINYDIPLLSSWSLYYYIYDSDNDNLLSDEIPQAMINTIWNIWQISWINLDTNREFTIATVSNWNNIPTNINISNSVINENVANWTTVWILSTTDIDLLDSHTYNFVSWSWDDDNWYFTIVWSNLNINISPDYEIKNSYSIKIQTNDWNWWEYQKNFTININNTWESVNTIIDFEDILNSYKYSVTSWTWTRTTNNPNEWLYSFESNNAWNNTQSCFQVTNTFSWTWTINFNYEVSSQTWSDFLRFYIDNIEQQAWSWILPYNLYTDTNISSWTHIYKWCYIKDNAWSTWTDQAFIDYIIFKNNSWDAISPTISSVNYNSWTLLPWWNHNMIINYYDLDSWIDISSDIISLNKWNGSIWWSDISATWFNLVSKIITTSWAIYPTNNLNYWKYRYNFNISDNASNISSTWSVFYIDEPEIIVSTWTIDIWNIKNGITKFSSWELNITVKTVWAWFDVILNKNTSLSEWSIEIIDWNTVEWVWYELSPYTSTINLINTNEIIATQVWSINIDWNRNTYIYNIKFWALIWEEQTAWDYESLIRFWIDMNY